MSEFLNYRSVNSLCPDFTARITSQMIQIISAMETNTYAGHFKTLYLEIKATELLLAQIHQLDHQAKAKLILKRHDIDALNDLKHFIDVNLFKPMSVVSLAIEAGINQTKLKSGFKKLFGCTLFEYIRDQRLEKAIPMLAEEGLTVSEVADAAGYQHSQHFTSAFKRKYGILPSRLRDY